MNNDQSFPLRIWSGLFSKKHWEKMGNAIWLYGMLIDKVTKEENGKGYVLGGKPISFNEWEKLIPISPRQYNRYMKLLVDEKYIETVSTGNGLRITILKSKKFHKKGQDKNGGSEGSDTPNLSPGSAINGGSDMPNMAVPSIDLTGDLKRAGKTPSEIASLWSKIYKIFGLPEQSMNGYQKQLVETVERLGFDITSKALDVFVKAKNDHPPNGSVKRIDDLLHFKKIDIYVGKIPKPAKFKYFVCMTCGEIKKIAERDCTQYFMGYENFCNLCFDNSPSDEPVIRRDVTAMVYQLSEKGFSRDQIKASIDGWREKENNENPID